MLMDGVLDNNVCGVWSGFLLWILFKVHFSLKIWFQIWDRKSLECLRILQGHTGSVLCLQYDETVVITGSSDSTIRWVFTHRVLGAVVGTIVSPFMLESITSSPVPFPGISRALWVGGEWMIEAIVS